MDRSTLTKFMTKLSIPRARPDEGKRESDQRVSCAGSTQIQIELLLLSLSPILRLMKFECLSRYLLNTHRLANPQLLQPKGHPTALPFQRLKRDVSKQPVELSGWKTLRCLQPIVK